MYVKECIIGVLVFHRARKDIIQTEVLKYQSDLEEALLTLGQFEKTYNEIMMWLKQSYEQIQGFDAICCDSESVYSLLAKYKVGC